MGLGVKGGGGLGELRAEAAGRVPSDPKMHAWIAEATAVPGGRVPRRLPAPDTLPFVSQAPHSRACSLSYSENWGCPNCMLELQGCRRGVCPPIVRRALPSVVYGLNCNAWPGPPQLSGRSASPYGGRSKASTLRR